MSFIFSLVTTCISVILVVASVVLIKSSKILESSIKDKITITLFLRESDSLNTVESIKGKLNNLGFVKSAKYLDKSEAAARFLKETGEDFKSVLDYNPLPASIEIVLKPEYIDKNSIQKAAAELKELDGVDDAVFQSVALFEILEILSSIRIYVFLSAFFLIAVSFYIVFSTNKLIIHSKQLEIETMKLVGAKLSAIKLPVILNGIIIGLAASLISYIFIRLLEVFLKNYIAEISLFNNEFYLIYFVTFICGPVIGLFASLFSVQKIALRLS